MWSARPRPDRTSRARAVAAGLALAAACATPAEREGPVAAGQGAAIGSTGFRRLASLRLGDGPHQIAFTPDGAAALVALAGDGAIARVDAASLRVEARTPVDGTPLGVAWRPGGGLAVTQFGEDRVVLLEVGGGEAPRTTAELATGAGPSLVVPAASGRWLVSAERADRLWLLDATTFSAVASFATGPRPFPPAATSDGRLAFVPSYEGGTLAVVDLWNERVAATVPVGDHPSGCAVLPGDVECAVVLRGEDRLAFVNTASKEVVGSLELAPESSPFAIAIGPDGRRAFVSGTQSDDVAVVDLVARRVVDRLPVGEVPIALAVHPSGYTLWVACEGGDRVDVIAVPRHAPPEAPPRAPVEVAVLGTIHGAHTTSERWGLDELRETIRRFDPDAVLAEIPPDRWERARREWAERRAVDEPRVRRFPEYTDVLLPLADELGFEIVPCAAWTEEMDAWRRARIAAFDTAPETAAARAEYEREQEQLARRFPEPPSDDPRVIHSTAYDERTRAELEPYDRHLNDWIGPGGWTNVNRAHLALIHAAIDARPGQRLLVTFGAGHKHRILDDLARRPDVRLIDVGPYLPTGTDAAREAETMEPPDARRCAAEVAELHAFFDGWFTGRLAADGEAFARFEGALAEDFQIVAPDGRASSRAEIVERLRAAHGSAPGAPEGRRVWVEDVLVRPVAPGVWLSTYEEWQESPAGRRGRLSSAVLREREGTPNGLEWVHVHEVWLEAGPGGDR